VAIFNRYSSSGHVINSDYPMTNIKKFLYMVFNGLLLLFPAIKQNFVKKKFTPSNALLEGVAQTHITPVSPSRMLSDLFWISLDWSSIEKHIGSPIKIFEVGCGTGRYGSLIESSYPIHSYTGLDLVESKEWAKVKNNGFNFVQSSFENFQEIVTDQNVIISQSALEHFDKDLLLMQQIGVYARKREATTYAIHLIPSSVGLFKFLFHGIRYYNLRSINQLIAHSSRPNSANVYFLGGPFSNSFHILNITLRSILFKKSISTIHPKEYYSKLIKAVVRDSKFGILNSASFYGVLMIWEKGE
jgi:hypothetical protein